MEEIVPDKDFIIAFNKKTFSERMGHWFRILGNSVISGSILTPNWSNPYCIRFVNPESKRYIDIKWENVVFLKDYTGPKVVSVKASKNIKNTVEEHVDKYGGTVKIDSLVAYLDQNEPKDQMLQIGFTTAISKSGTITVKNILSGRELKLTNSKRHFVIDETILERLMILKLSHPNK